MTTAIKFQRSSEIHPYSHGDRVGHPAWGTRLVWYLHGPLGVVQFVLRFDQKGRPQPWDVGYHSPTEIDTATHMETCDLFDGRECWYDGTSLHAETVWTRVLREGDDALWAELEACYRDWLEARA